jgi:copper resistance protein C
MRRMKTLLAAALLVFAATPAFAHAHLLQAQPANAAIVATSPTVLTLKFSEGIALAFTGLVVTGPTGEATLGAAHLDAGDDTLLVVPLAAPLVAGTYTVVWHALSSDGHKTTGSYAFTVK